MEKFKEFVEILRSKKADDMHGNGADELPPLQCSSVASSSVGLEEKIEELKKLFFQLKEEHEGFSQKVDTRFFGLADNVNRNIDRLDKEIDKLSNTITWLSP